MAATPTILPKLQRAIAAYQAGNLREAEAICAEILTAREDADTLHLLAIVQAGLGQANSAITSFDRALALQPQDVNLLSSRAVILLRLQRPEEAIATFDRILARQPHHAEIWNNRGNALMGLQRFAEALRSYDRALSSRPGYADALNNRAIALQGLNRLDEALASQDQALQLRPNDADGHFNRGTILQKLRRFGDALASYDGALVLRPDDAAACNNRGFVLYKMRRFEEALASFDRALALRADYAEALNNRGLAMRELHRPEEAIASYERALALRPDYVEALNNRGLALADLKRPAEALASYDRALEIRPDDAEALYNRGLALEETGRFEDALGSFDRASALGQKYAFGAATSLALKLCDWARSARHLAALEERIGGGNVVVSPFLLLGCTSDLGLQLRAAQRFCTDQIPVLPQALGKAARDRDGKLRIAYLSADFRPHAMMHLLPELFERHDRSRFETFALSFGPEDQSALRARLEAAFAQFHDVQSQSDREAAQLLCDLRVDIAVDLMGHTDRARPGILAYRPAPIQVSYLGYPGTSGMPFMDNVLADETVAPFLHQPFYAEKIVHLPGSYRVNDTKRRVAARAPSRQEAGLPDQGFVFCCFNTSWKIAPEIFDVWMRLLRQIEGSVLWLLRSNAGAETNLRRAARERGVDPARLVFAAPIRPDAHLARHVLADLFLDTLPYNAHTTASDALWMGLPVLTCKGEAFAGRVGASLLEAVGLPELVTSSLAEYETAARDLALDAARLGAIKDKLRRNRETHSLFDTARAARHIEAAYATMWEIYRRGEPPRTFRVDPRA